MLRLVAWTISTVALVAVIETAERTTQAIDGDVAGWIDSIPESGRQLGRIAIAVVALLALAIVVLALVVRSRWRRLITLGATGALAGGVVIGLGELTGLIDDAAVLDEAVLAEGIAPQAPSSGWPPPSRWQWWLDPGPPPSCAESCAGHSWPAWPRSCCPRR